MKNWRNALYPVAGLAVIGHETLISCARPRVELLVVAMSLCGLPIMKRADEVITSVTRRRHGSSSRASRS